MRDLLEAGEKMRLQYYGQIGVLLLFSLGSAARAGTTTFVGGYVIGNGDATPLTGFKIRATTPQLGGGLLMAFDLADKGGGVQMELGILYMPRGFEKVLDDQSLVTVSQSTLQVPLLVRIPVFSGASLGIGSFVSYALTSTSSLNPLDYGVVGSFAVRFGLRKKIDLLVDLRYQFGLENLNSSPGFGTHFYDLQGLVGVLFGF